MMRILLIKPSALGDIAHSLPVLTAVRKLYPEAHISWLVNQAYRGLLDHHPHLNEIIPFERSLFKKHPSRALQYAWQFKRKLRQGRFDMVLDLQGLLRSGLMTWATRAPRRLGFRQAREGARYAYTELIDLPQAKQLHAVERYWKMVEHLGGSRQSLEFHVPIQAQELQKAQATLASFPSRRIGLAVGSRWRTKQWHPEHFGSIVQRIADATKQDCTFLFLGSRDDRPVSESIMEAAGVSHALNLCGQTEVSGLVAYTSLVDLFLANDTGPLHIAAALGKDCVAPYTCTQIQQHGPYPRIEQGLETTVACAGSYLKKCPHGLICMDDLTPDKLWPRVEEVLRKWPQRQN